MEKQIFKKIIISCLAISMIAPMGLTTAYAIDENNDDTRGMEQTIKVGYQPNYGIIDEPFVRGSEGYGYEYLSKIESNSDYNFEYIPVDWAEGMEKLKNGEIDIFGPASMTEERKKDYEYVETPFSFETANIYALENSEYQYGDAQYLDGLTFGAVEGSIHEHYFDEYAEKNNIDYSIKYTEYTKEVKAIKDGEIDVFIGSSLDDREDVEVVEQLHSENLFLITQKGNTMLSEGINAAMLAVEAENPAFNELLWDKYYGDVQLADLTLTAEEITALKQKDVYTVGYHVDWKPQTFKMEDGTPKGFAIDIMDALAKKLNIKIEYVPLHDEANNDVSKLDFNLCLANDECVHYG